MSDKPSFEDTMQRLSQVVDELEHGDAPLEKAVALYKEGLALAASCRKSLDAARHDITIFQEGLVREFDARAAGTDDNGAGDEH